MEKSVINCGFFELQAQTALPGDGAITVELTPMNRREDCGDTERKRKGLAFSLSRSSVPNMRLNTPITNLTNRP